MNDPVKHIGVASRSYQAAATEYESARPGYPARAIDHLALELGLGSASTILDLAAGTGKLTRLLLPIGSRVVAAEPVAGMRAQLGAAVPEALLIAAAAESIPLADSSVDCITVGHAFHWFRAQEALAEMHRILRPGGHLALLWNRPDRTEPWVARFTAIAPHSRSGRARGVRRVKKRLLRAVRRGATDGRGQPAWMRACSEAFGSTELFGELQRSSFAHAEEMVPNQLVDLVESLSSFTRMPAERQDRVRSEIERLAGGMPTRFSFPYITEVFWTGKRI